MTLPPSTPSHFSLQGIAAVPGIAIGTVVIAAPTTSLAAIPARPCSDIKQEQSLARHAFASAKADLEQARAALASQVSQDELSLFDVYIHMLDETNLGGEVLALIEDGQWAAGALSRVILSHTAHFAEMSDMYLRERATDIYDLGMRVLSYLLPKERTMMVYPEATILVGHTLAAIHLTDVPTGQLVGVVTTTGSQNSHLAILARAMGIPAILGVSDLPIPDCDGQWLVMDGSVGRLILGPNEEDLRTYRQLQQQEQAFDADLQAFHHTPSQTQDGVVLDLYVNAGLAIDAGLPLSMGAKGVGLFRTEVPFSTRKQFPTVAEQLTGYQQLLQAFAPQPVVMRLVDIGADKPLPYFPVEENNPALGWRGIRLLLGQAQILTTQLEAMLRASVGYANLSILVPMVTDTWELAAVHSHMDQTLAMLVEEGLTITRPSLGAMLEVPATVELIPALAQYADFFSVGSNDLTQYILAVDRDNAKVANYYDGLHPAVLLTLKRMVDLAHQVNRPISLCGELASDPLALPLLLAMGFDSLSMNASGFLRIKYVLCQITLTEAQALLAKVLTYTDAKQVRLSLESWLGQRGLYPSHLKTQN